MVKSFTFLVEQLRLIFWGLNLDYSSYLNEIHGSLEKEK